jgi:hypothetical protein
MKATVTVIASTTTDVFNELLGWGGMVRYHSRIDNKDSLQSITCLNSDVPMNARKDTKHKVTDA